MLYIKILIQTVPSWVIADKSASCKFYCKGCFSNTRSAKEQNSKSFTFFIYSDLAKKFWDVFFSNLRLTLAGGLCVNYGW